MNHDAVGLVRKDECIVVDSAFYKSAVNAGRVNVGLIIGKLKRRYHRRLMNDKQLNIRGQVRQSLRFYLTVRFYGLFRFRLHMYLYI